MNFGKYRNSVLSSPKKDFWSLAQQLNTNDPIALTSSTVWASTCQNNSAIFISDIVSNNSIVLAAGSPVLSLDLDPFGQRDVFKLAAGLLDSTIKIWNITNPISSTTTTQTDPTMAIILKTPGTDKGVDNVLWNPIADDILLSSSSNQICIWDISQSSNFPLHILKTPQNDDSIQNVSWKKTGDQFAAVGKDNFLRIFDARLAKELMNGVAHVGVKPSRVCWLGDSSFIVTTGFNQRRDREFSIWDTRNGLVRPVSTEKLDSNQGILNPVFDMDTKILYLIGKGDSGIKFFEIDLVSGAATQSALRFTTPLTFVGGVCVSKWSLDVMKGEIGRILLLSSDGKVIMPVSNTVPRRSYADFHADIFPDTKSDSIPPMSASEWIANPLLNVPVFSLDPSKKIKIQPRALISVNPTTPKTTTTTFQEPLQQKPASTSNSIKDFSSSVASMQINDKQTPIQQTTTTFNITHRSGLYRFITGKASSSIRMDDLRCLSIQIPNESNSIVSNSKFLAFPISGGGGRIANLSVETVGRLPLKIPCFISGSDVLDFKLNPFDKQMLVTSTDDGKIPEKGLDGDCETPISKFTAHHNRVSLIYFHPIIKNLLFTSSPENGNAIVKLFDITNLHDPKEIMQYVGHGDNVLAVAVGGDEYGLLATFGKDKILRIFDVRSGRVLRECASHEGIKGCRLNFLGDSGDGSFYLASIGFSKASQREIRIFDSKDLLKNSCTTFDTSPSLFESHFDNDLNLLYLSGRGDNFVAIFEINFFDKDTPPKAFFLARFEGTGVQQDLSFGSKKDCDVRIVEVAKAWRITQSFIEQVSFTVPRLKKQFFQDDIFVPTLDTDKSLGDAQGFQNGVPLKERDYINLQPVDMSKLSEAVEVVIVKRNPKDIIRELTEAEKKEQSMKEMFRLAQETEARNWEDNVEGVSDSEW